MRYIDWKKLLFSRQPFKLYLLFKIMSKLNLDDSISVDKLNAVLVLIDTQIKTSDIVDITKCDIGDIAIKNKLEIILDNLDLTSAKIADMAIDTQIKNKESLDIIEPTSEFVKVKSVLEFIKCALKLTLAKTAKIKHSSRINANINLTMEAFFRAFIIHSSEIEINDKVTTTNAGTNFITIADIESIINEVEFTNCDIEFVKAVNELSLNNSIQVWLAPIRNIYIGTNTTFDSSVKTTLFFSSRLKHISSFKVNSELALRMYKYFTWNEYNSNTWASISSNSWNEIKITLI